jgi:hypothetical protein
VVTQKVLIQSEHFVKLRQKGRAKFEHGSNV